MRRCVLLFVKYPEPGKVKTRLAATLGAERAAEIYRLLTVEVLLRLPGDAEVLVMCDPPAKVPEITAWLCGVSAGIKLRFAAQAAGDLGVRLETAFSETFAAGFEQVAAIGSDCVEITPAHFTGAWTALATHDAALGPTHDGGYYLLALRAPQPALFRDIAWSTDSVCRETQERAASAGLRVRLLPALRDVDTAEDWRRVQSGELRVEC